MEVEAITLKGNSSDYWSGPRDPLNHDGGRKSDDQPHIHFFLVGIYRVPIPFQRDPC